MNVTLCTEVPRPCLPGYQSLRDEIVSRIRTPEEVNKFDTRPDRTRRSSSLRATEERGREKREVTDTLPTCRQDNRGTSMDTFRTPGSGPGHLSLPLVGESTPRGRSTEKNSRKCFDTKYDLRTFRDLPVYLVPTPISRTPLITSLSTRPPTSSLNVEEAVGQTRTCSVRSQRGRDFSSEVGLGFH